MRGIASLALAFTLVVGVAPAYALNFDFSFTNNSGNVSGTITGEVFGLVDNVTSQATNVVIDSYPAGLTLPAAPWDIFSAPGTTVDFNSFFVLGDDVASGQLILENGVIHLELNGDTVNSLRDSAGNFVTQSPSRNQIVFTPAPVPEPVSISLLISGLLGIGLARRR